MITWKEKMVIDADIETVWSLFRDENIKRIMPKVEEHQLIEKREDEAGAKHKQTYREGKRLETYTVHTDAYEDHTDRKYKKTRFIIGKAFQVTASFTLIKIEEEKTEFVYEGENKGVNFVGRAMMKLANKSGNNKVVFEFLERVKQEAEQMERSTL